MPEAAYTRVWSPLSDEALLAGFRARDPDASAAFVRRFQTRVFGLALTIVRDRADAEEVAQDVFVRAWRRADAYDPRRGEVATWLLAIARNVAIDHARMRRSDPVGVDLTVLLGDAADPERSPEERRFAADDAARSITDPSVRYSGSSAARFASFIVDALGRLCWRNAI